MNILEYASKVGKTYLTESCEVFCLPDSTSIGLVTEIAQDSDQRLILRGILGTVLDERNVNGRIYTTKEMQKAIDYANGLGLFKAKRFLCAADDHPVTDFVPPSRASHIILDAYIKDINGKNYLLFDILVLRTQNGRDLEELIRAGASIGTSIRGFGNQNPTTDEVEDYELVGFDFVGDPSAGTFSTAENHNAEIKVESVKADKRTRVLESNEVDSSDSDVDTSSTEDDSSDTNSYNAENQNLGESIMDYEMELIKLEQRNKGKSYTESTLQDLVTLKNKLVIESKIDAKEIEDNAIYSRMYNECVNAIKSTGVAKVEQQLSESKDLAEKAKQMLQRVMVESQKQINEAKEVAKKAVAERREAMKKLAKIQRESVNIEDADRHMLEQCKVVSSAANKEMRKVANHCRMLENRMKARNVVMKVLSSK